MKPDGNALHRAAEHLALPDGDLTAALMAGLFGTEVAHLDARAELDAATRVRPHDSKASDHGHR